MNRFNFIPDEIKEEKRAKIYKLKYAVLALSFVCTAFLALYIPHAYINKLESKEETLLKDLKNCQASIYNVNEAHINNQLYKEYLRAESLLLEQKSVLYGSISKLVDMHIPQREIYVDSLEYKKGEIQITGSTSNYNMISSFINGINELGVFSEARLLNIKRGFKPESFSFTISVTL